MKVSDLARHVGIAPSAVRFYESLGVLPRAERRENGYREYDASDVGRLRIVVGLRHLGLDPVEAGRLASLCVSGQCDVMSEDLAIKVDEQRQQIARQRLELDELDRELATLQAALAAGLDTAFTDRKEILMTRACCGPECPCPCPPDGPCC